MAFDLWACGLMAIWPLHPVAYGRLEVGGLGLTQR